MKAIWTLEEIISVLGAQADGVVSKNVTGISIDTRSLQKGDVFVALQGDHSDGHAYVAQAMQAGAVAAIVSSPQAVEGEIVVEDSLQALEALAVAARARIERDATVFAITGSVGKTGARVMMDLALQAQGEGGVYASIKSYNNHWGVPLCLAKMPQQTDYAVFEIGMSNAGEIRPLTKMVQPNIALITTIQAQHIENFDSIEGIARAKGEIFDGLVAGGVAVLPIDNPHHALLCTIAQQQGVEKIINFGESAQADLRITDVTVDVNGSRATIHCDGARIALFLPVMGAHLLRNACGVLACIHAAGLDVAKAAQGLAQYQNPEGRGGLFWLNGGADDASAIGILDDSYNAAPVAMMAGLDVLHGLAQASGRRKVAVLGDIYELGDRREEVIAMLVEKLVEIKVDQLHGCGPMMTELMQRLPTKMQGIHADDHEVLAQALPTHIQDGDLVMIKGSRGPGQKPRMQVVMEKLCDALRMRVNSAH